MKNFRTFDLAVEFYRACCDLPAKGHVKDQLRRAAYSIALNLAEGRGKQTTKEQKRFFYISLGSLRECQAILSIEQWDKTEQWQLLDNLGAHLYRLIKNAQ